MAVKKPKDTGGAHWAVGANVVLMVVLAVALVAGVQWIGYAYSSRIDLTSTGVNSLTPATKSLLRDLDTDVTITSMYYSTDMESEDQARYRSAVNDLIELYRATNRTKIKADSLNPLQDHEKRKEVLKRLAGLAKFKDEAADYVKAVETFQGDMLGRITTLIGDEIAQLDTFGALQGQDAQLVGKVKPLYADLQDELTQAGEEIADALASDVPAYSAAVAGVQQAYTAMIRLLETITGVGSQIALAPGQLDPAVEEYFVGAEARYDELLAAMKAEQQSLQSLPALSIDDIIRGLGDETGNAILVESADDARVVSFRDIWPPMDPRTPPRGFSDRRFLGEQKLTSAILQLTQKEKPAVVFIRFGGPPLFFGGFMPGQPPALLSRMKAQLEDANFSVYEWDLAKQNEMSAIDPPPSRTIFVVMRPTPPPRNPFGQQPQQAPFSPENLAAVKKALGESPRAIFLTGWMSAAGPMSTGYEYADYLRSNWGIEADCDRLLLVTDQIAAEKYRFARDPLRMTDPVFSSHPIVEGLGRSRALFPLVSPLGQTETAPEGVTIEKLAWFEPQQGLWSIGDIGFYQQQQKNEFIIRNSQDYEGEFTMALAATKGDAKIVVVSSTDFAVDHVALAQGLVMTSQGLAIRPLNPGNAALFINSLHWLNDNTEWMNLGTPIDYATIAVESNSGAMTFVRVLALVIWPAIAACLGGIVWMVRRR